MPTIDELQIKQRTIRIKGKINADMAEDICAYMEYLDCEDNTRPIKLIISSPGGDIDAGLAIYDTMRSVKSPVYTAARGMAASMAAVLLAAGDKRFATKHAKILIHQALQGHAEGFSTIFEARENLEQLENANKDVISILSEHCHKPYEEIEKLTYKKDYIMMGEAAKEFGIIDEIIKFKDEKE